MTISATTNQEDALAELLQATSGDDLAEILLEPDTEPDMNPDTSAVEALAAQLADLGAIDTATEPKLEPKKPEGAAVTPAKAEKPTKLKVERKHYANKVDRMKDRMGADLGGLVALEEGDDIEAKREGVFAALQESGVKVQNRIAFVLEFVTGKSAKLNGVMQTAFKLLKADGSITTGDDGNMIKALTAQGKTIRTARAMGNNAIAALRTLKVVTKDEKGGYVANPQSVVLTKMNSMLAL